MEEQKKSSKKVWIGIVAFVAVIAIFVGVFLFFRPGAMTGTKNITIEVINKAQESTSYKVKTDAEYLRQAMEDAKGLSFEGIESEYGMMVNTVNGETADYSVDGSYWSFYINGEYCNYGIDSQPVTDGDAFQIVYTVFVSE